MTVANALRGLDWVGSNIGHFDLTPSVDVRESMLQLKPVGELVLTLDVLLGRSIDVSRCRDLLSRCWAELRAGTVLTELLAVRPDLIVAATIYACFTKHGFRDCRLDGLLRHLSRSPAAMSVELPRWRRLDVLHGLAEIGLLEFPEDPSAQTWFGALPEPWTITNDLAYATTHNIFYITDFGKRPERLPAVAREYLCTWLPAWLRIFERERNWDIFAELLMVGCCIGAGEAFPAQFRLLADAQQADGSVLGPSGSADAIVKADMPGEKAYFLRNYHTTLVSSMAFAMNPTLCGYARNEGWIDERDGRKLGVAGTH